jgi:hypothetical protein
LPTGNIAEGTVIVRLVLPEMLPKVAVMAVVPADTEEAFPLEPVALLTVATDAFDELHVTAVVRSCVLLSEKVPVAVNCSDVPRVMPGLTGVTVMDTSVGINDEPQENKKGEAKNKKMINKLILFKTCIFSPIVLMPWN